MSAPANTASLSSDLHPAEPVARVQVKPTWADVAYGALAPGVFAGVRLGARWLGTSPAELQEREGNLPAAAGPLLWFHGASAGEMAAAARLVCALRAAFDFVAGYTTTNQAGVAVSRRALQPRDRAALAPWDAPRWVARGFECWRPRALFLVETELWPGLVFDAVRRGVPVFSVSARIYPRDEPRYRLIRSLIAPTLRRLTLVLAQNESERARFLRLGVRPERCVVAGDLKHAPPPVDADGVTSLRSELGIGGDDPIIVCGSVHADEIELLSHALAHRDVSAPRFVIAPRHADAVAPILAAAQRHGWRVYRRSAGVPPSDWRVLLWDTYGELGRAYALATVAIVGGSFAPHGGHNLLEPIAAGAPVLFGPYTDHWRDDARRLTACHPDACVRDVGALQQRLSTWLGDAALRAAVLAQQRHALPDGEAIANQYVAVLSPWLREMGLEVA